jgi:hypothetical protein
MLKGLALGMCPAIDCQALSPAPGAQQRLRGRWHVADRFGILQRHACSISINSRHCGVAGFSNRPTREKVHPFGEKMFGERAKTFPPNPRPPQDDIQIRLYFKIKSARSAGSAGCFRKTPKRLFAPKSFPKQPALFGVLASQGLWSASNQAPSNTI